MVRETLIPTTWDALLIAVLFMIPGFVADAVIGKQFARRKREPTELVLNILLLTLIDYAVCSPLLLWLDSQVAAAQYADFIHAHRVLCLTISIAVLFVAPTLLATAIGHFARKEWGRQLLHAVFSVKLDDPEEPPTVWDFVFKPDRAYQIVATLTDGSKVAGGFAGKSRVSTYPEEQELYLEVLYALGDDGTIGAPLQLSEGVLLKRTDIRSLEFYAVAEVPGGSDEEAHREQPVPPGPGDDAGHPPR